MTSPSNDQHELYRAYSQSYASEANKRRTAFLVDLAFAAVAAAIAVLTVSNAAEGLLDLLSGWLPPVALLWLAIRETGLLGDDKQHRHTAVTIQEQFDLTFWKSDRWTEGWNRLLCREPVQQRKIKELALDYQGDPLPADYWVDTAGLPPNDAAILRIQQTAGWGARGHDRYARLNRVPALIGLFAVLMIAVVVDLGARETTAVLFAVAPFLVGRLQSARAHMSLARRRESLELHMQELLRNRAAPTDAHVRTAQDELYRIRLEHRRIPAWLYNRYADRDRRVIDTAVAQEADLLRSKYRVLGEASSS